MNSMQAEILSSALLSELSKGARWTVRGGVTLVISVHILKLSKKGTVNYFTYDQVSSICVTVQIIQTDPDLITWISYNLFLFLVYCRTSGPGNGIKHRHNKDLDYFNDFLEIF